MRHSTAVGSEDEHAAESVPRASQDQFEVDPERIRQSTNESALGGLDVTDETHIGSNGPDILSPAVEELCRVFAEVGRAILAREGGSR